MKTLVTFTARVSRRVRPFCRLLAALALVSTSAQAGDIVWTNTAGGSWTVSKNWSPNSVPGGTDRVYITAPGSYTVSLGTSTSVNQLTVGDGAGTQTLSVTAGTLTLKGNGNLAPGGIIDFAGDRLTGGGTLTVNGLFRWVQGIVSTPINVAAAGQLDVSGSKTKTLSATTLNNAGLLRLAGNGLVLESAATLSNTGLLQVQNDFPFTALSTTGRPSVVNNGTWEQSSATAHASFSYVDFRNSRDLNLGGAILRLLTGAHNFQAGTTLSNTGAVRVEGGDLTLSGTITFPTPLTLASGKLKGVYTLNGDLTMTGGTNESRATIAGNSRWTGGRHSGTNTIEGLLELAGGDSTGALTLNDILWTGGTNSGSSTLLGTGTWSGGNLTGLFTVASNAFLQVRSGLVKSVTGGHLLNYGTLHIPEDAITVDPAGDISNRGLTILTNGTPFLASSTVPGDFFNHGRLLKTGRDITTWSNLRLSSTNHIQIDEGTLALSGGSNILSSGFLTGSGKLSVTAAGSLNLPGGITSSLPLELTDGTLHGNGFWNGDLIWLKGNIAARLTVPASGSVTLTSSGAKSLLNGALLEIFGASTINGASLKFFGNATFNNHGTLDLQNDTPFTVNGTDKPFLNNYGTLIRSTSIKVFDPGALRLFHAGTLDLRTAGLTLSTGAHVFTNNTAAIGNYRVRLDGAALSLTGPVAMAQPFEINSGILSGTNTLNADLLWTGGEIAGDTTLGRNLTWNNGLASGMVSLSGTGTWSGGNLTGFFTVASNALLQVRSGLVKSVTGGHLLNYGTLHIPEDAITVDPAGDISNRGLTILTNGTPFLAPGTVPGDFFNHGRLLKTGRDITTWSNLRLSSTNHIQIDEGTLALSGGSNILSSGFLTGSGKLSVTAAGSLNLPGGITSSLPLELTDGTLHGNGFWNGDLIWLKGNIAARLTVPASGSVTLTSSGAKSLLNGALLEIFGASTINGASLKFFGNATFNNHGTLDLQNDTPFTVNGTDKPFLNNYGTLIRSTSIKVFDPGALRLFHAGTLDLRTAGLTLSTGAHVFTNNTAAIGNYRVRLDGAALSLTGPVAMAQPFEINSGILSGTNTLNADLLWTGGEIAGNTTVPRSVDWQAGLLSGTISNSAGNMTIVGTGTRTISGQLVNLSTLTLSSGPIAFQAGGIIRNQGLLENRAANPWTAAAGISARVINPGTIRNGATNALDFNTVTLENSGLMEAAPGNITFSGGSHSFTSASILDGTGSFRVTGGTISIGNLLTARTGLDLALGQITGSGTINGNLTMSGGLLPGTIILNGNLSWSGGTVSGVISCNGPVDWTGGTVSGSLTLPVSRVLLASGIAPKIITGTVNNNGRMILADDRVVLQMDGGSTINNAGLFETSGRELARTVTGARPKFINTGTWLKLGSLSLVVGGEVELRNSGLVNIQGGGITLAAGSHTFSNGASTDGPGSFQIDGAALTLAGTVSARSPFTFRKGSIVANGTLNGNWTWLEGTLSGSLITPAPYEITLTGTGACVLAQDALLRSGGHMVLETGTIQFGNNAELRNEGLFECRTESAFTISGTTAKGTFTNLGRFLRSTSPTAFLFKDVALMNSGTIEAASSPVIFTARNHTFSTGSRLLGPNPVRISGASLAVSGSISNEVSLELTAGTISGTATLANDMDMSGGTLSAILGLGSLRWNGGEVSGKLTPTRPSSWLAGLLSGDLTISLGVNLQIFSSEAKTLTGNLRNSGSVTLASAATLLMNDGSLIDNSGNFDCWPETPWSTTSGARPRIINSGTFQKLGLTDLLLTSAVEFRQNGTFTINTNQVRFLSGSHSFGDKAEFNGPGQLAIEGAQVAISGTITFSNAVMASGLLLGNGTFKGDWEWRGGAINATLTVPDPFTLNIASTNSKTTKDIVLNNQGMIRVQTNATVAFDRGTFNNPGTLVLMGNQPFLSTGSTRPVLNNSGLLQRTAPSGTLLLNTMRLVNTGTIENQAGTIALVMDAHSLNRGSRLTGPGTLLIDGATVILKDVIPVEGLLQIESGVVQDNPTINGNVLWRGGEITGDWTMGGNMTWQGGSLSGSITTRTNTQFNLGAGGQKALSGGAIYNYGGLAWNGQSLQASSSALIMNYGTMDVAGPAAVVHVGGAKLALNNYGSLNLTNGPGIMSIDGTFRQYPTGKLYFDAAGAVAGTNHSQIYVSGTTTMDGSVTLSGRPGYVPASGDRMVLMRFGSRSGKFNTVFNDLNLSPVFTTTNFLMGAFPPLIVQGPVDTGVTYRGNTSFMVDVNGTAPFSYQWFFNDAALSGATNSTLPLSLVNTNQDGTYMVAITNAWGSTNASARLMVYVTPAITQPPVAQTAAEGRDATFRVTATGTYLKYQWKLNNVVIPGATNDVLELSQVGLPQAGKYRVEVSNPIGSVISSEVTLTILYYARITEQTEAVYTDLNRDITMTVKATGTAPLTYQWYREESAIAGATSASLEVRRVALANVGNYRVVVSNLLGTVSSAPIPLQINAAPVITTQPESQTVAKGADVTLRVVATGVPAPYYQWLLNGVTIPGASKSTLYLPAVEPKNAGVYRVTVANIKGMVQSQPAELTVASAELAFADNFTNRGVLYTASGSGHASNVGATRENYEPKHAGKSRATNSVWISWWAPANGIVNFNTSGSDFDTVLAVYRGDSLNVLQKVASDDDTGGYHASSLSFNAVAGTYYQVAVAGFDGIARGKLTFSWDLTATAEKLPQITEGPSDYTVTEGDSIPLTVVFDSFDVTTVQWFYQGLPIAGATNTTFNLPAVQASEVGEYRVLLRAANGRTVISGPADLQINTSGYTDVAARNKFSDVVDFTSLGETSPDLLKRRRAVAGIARGYTSTQVFSTVGSDRDAGEPDHCGIPGGASRWFAYRAEADGRLVFNTDGSDFDTVLAIYTGLGIDYASLVSVACDNDSGLDGRDSAVAFDALRGTTYWVAVDGVNGASGKVVLNYTLGVAPTIQTNPVSGTVAAGSNVTLRVTGAGSPLPRYQWHFNGGALPGATNSTLTISNFNNGKQGLYHVVLTNAIGTATSSMAELLLQGPLTVKTYGWQKNKGFSFRITGESSATYVLECTDDFVSWIPIATNLNCNGIWDITDPTPGNVPSRFYRVMKK